MFGYGNLTFRVPMVANILGMLDTNVNMQTQWLFSVVPFFMMGWGINRKKLSERWEYRYCEVLLCTSIAGYFVEVILIQMLDLKQSTTLCLFTYPVVYFLLLVSQKHPFMLGGSKRPLYVAGMASFIYFSHILFVLIFQRVGFYETPTYIATVLITGTMGYFTVKSKNMLIKKLI